MYPRSGLPHSIHPRLRTKAIAERGDVASSRSRNCIHGHGPRCCQINCKIKCPCGNTKMCASPSYCVCRITSVAPLKASKLQARSFLRWCRSGSCYVMWAICVYGSITRSATGGLTRVLSWLLREQDAGPNSWQPASVLLFYKSTQWLLAKFELFVCARGSDGKRRHRDVWGRAEKIEAG